MKFVNFIKCFPDGKSCELHQKQVREKVGVVCCHCGCTHHRWASTINWVCSKCGHHITLRCGTVLHGFKMPLMYWFTAIYLMSSTKKIFLALQMQRQLGHKRYQPIWKIMHKLRSVIRLRDDKYKLDCVINWYKGFFTCDGKRNDGQKLNHLKSALDSEVKASVLPKCG